MMLHRRVAALEKRLPPLPKDDGPPRYYRAATAEEKAVIDAIVERWFSRLPPGTKAPTLGSPDYLERWDTITGAATVEEIDEMTILIDRIHAREREQENLP
jgi:hypothetical protein